MNNKTYIILGILLGCSLYSCSRRSTNYFKTVPHITWDGKYTGLSNIINIEGCFYGDGNYDPFRFDDYGFVSCSDGYMVGAYRISNDSIYADLYDDYGPLGSDWNRSSFCFISPHPDTLLVVKYMYSNVGDTTFKWGQSKRRIYKRFDCPEDLKLHDGFLRKQKWMWESDEARKEWKRNHKNK